ncbi:MAG: ABC transporter substrate-binding protein, partial [Chloroflexi bacterium]|nr:ABC transporter substrate-binding protein [Chloroflexota bacterium]
VPEQEEVATEAPVAESAEPVELVYWHALTGPAADAQDELVKRFNESQDLIHVTSELQGATYSDLSTKILADVAAGGGADVSQLGTYEILQFSKSGVLVDLNPYVSGDNGLDTSSWPSTMIDAGVVDGNLNWLPFNVSVPVLYYNKEAFEEAGLAGPPQTWDEYFDYAEQLTVKDANGNVTRAGAALWNITWPFLSAVWSNGGEFTTMDYSNITFDDPVVVDVMTKFQDLIKDGAAVIPDSASGGHRGAFMNGQAAMILDSPAPYGDIMANSVGFTPAVALYPEGTAGRVYAPGGGGIVMLTSCPEEKRAAAWEFMKYMLSPESIAYYGEQSGYAVFYPEAAEAAADFLSDENFAIMNSASEYLRGDFSMNGSPAVRTAFDEALLKILIDKADVQSTLESADAKAEKDIQNETFAP